MNPLKYGQIIRICNDGLIVAKGYSLNIYILASQILMYII